MSLLLLFACTASVPLGSTGVFVVPGEEYVPDTGLEEVGGVDPGTDGEVTFDDSYVHTIHLEIGDYAWTSLQYNPTTYTEVQLLLDDGEEIELGLDPTDPDTDGDGIEDGDELVLVPFVVEGQGRQ